ncbi:hypothetical protein Ac42p004 [Acinetobacter phage Ac42]|uniref:hypothetical protein n=1 Tax=Acinetobacter phage Ac42 TaxID=762660 RepID=UPI0001EBCC66|nr:hypothetical protein Ac42p004 [Acinetobacter phage Ac42]ADI96242.1 hypothetical protein Ac42p004 [Acinetobacter phage Ac42]
MKIKPSGNMYLDYFKENNLRTTIKSLTVIKDSVLHGKHKLYVAVNIPESWKDAFIAIDPDGTMCIYQYKPVPFENSQPSSVDNSSWDIAKIEDDFVDFAVIEGIQRIGNWKDLCISVSGDLIFDIK